MIILPLLVFIFGTLAGSLLIICIERLPKDKPLLASPFLCPHCRRKRNYLDLVPVVGYMLSKGKCRYCKKRSSQYNFPIELLAGIISIVLFYRFSLTMDFAAFLFLMYILTAVFFIDLEHRIIPDKLVITGLAGGCLVFLYNIFIPMQIYGDNKWWNPLAGMAAGSGLLLLTAVLGMIIYRNDDAMGMGDVKIFAPIGIFLGWKMTLLALLFSVILAGVFSLLLIILRLAGRKSTIPLGPFIVTGVFITILWGWDIVSWYMGRM